jgi:peptidyl-prolyl cis-trans isomerase C
MGRPEQMRVRIETARPGLAALIVGVCLLALAACERTGADNRPPEPGDAAVATVDDQTVWASDVKHEAVRQGVIGEGEPLDVSSEVFHRVLDEVVDQKLLAAEAVRHNIQNDPVARRRLAIERERILGDLLVGKMVEQAVNEKAIHGLYDEQIRLSKQSEQFHARQIVVASQTDADAVKKLLATGANFDALAMERSIDSATRFNGGDLGYFTTDVMPAAYVAVLKPAKVGDILGPFKTDAGFVVLKVEDRRPEQPISLEEARPQIVRFLTYDQVRDLLEKLRGKAKVKMLIARTPGGSGPAREPASAPPPVASSAPLDSAATPPSGLKPAVSSAAAAAAPTPPAKAAPAKPAPAAPAKPAKKP